MENKKEKNYYETLDIPRDATPVQIKEAYNRARAVYSEGSVAIYSLYTSDEREQKLNELNDMYATLADPARKKTYDEYLGTISAPPPPTPRPVQRTQNDTSADWPADAVDSGRDIFDEYTEAGAFKDRLTLKQDLMVMNGHDPMVVEKYRMLYMKLEEISLKNSYKTYAITSAVKNEGKTMTALNLAYVMATEFKKKVLLIEADLRNPSISSNYLDMGRLHGLVDVIKGDSDLKNAINRLDDTLLYFLPARCSVKNSSVLLDSPRMRGVLKDVKEDFDYIIIDAPPILPMVDISILSKTLDAIMLVVRAGKTPKDLVRKAVNALPKNNLMGIILNGADDVHMKKYYY